MHGLRTIPTIARKALIVAAVLLGLLVLEWYLVFHVSSVGHLDATAYQGFLGLAAHPHVSALATRIASLCNPDRYVFLAIVPVLLALLRRRAVVAGAIVVILAGANLTTEVLKPLLAAVRPDGLPAGHLLPGSWPSGHATASMTLALCAVLAVPRRRRPLVATLGAGFAVAVCYSFLALGWHYPSDALAGLLVASIWTLLGVAGISVLDARRRGSSSELPEGSLSAGRALAPSALAAGAVLVLGAIAAALRPGAVAAYAHDHHAFIAVALSVGAAALLLPAAVLLAIRR